MPSKVEPAQPTTASATEFDAIGAPWRIGVGGAGTSRAELGSPLAAHDLAAVLERIERFDRDWSRFRDDSLVTRIARTGGTHRLPADAGPLMAIFERLFVATDARLSPLVGASLERLGYDATYRLQPAGDPVAAPRWDDAISLRPTAEGLEIDAITPVMLDVGAAGKGYLVDIVGDLLAERGVTDTLIDASGDVRVRGERSIRVALENPVDASKAVGVVEVRDAAICASAITRRTWGDGLHHIVDAVTGTPTVEVLATWVVAATALEADALATALFVTEPARLTAEFDLQWVRLTIDGRLEASANFTGELFV